MPPSRRASPLVSSPVSSPVLTFLAKVALVVVFGDPFNGRAVGTVSSSKVKNICHDQDIICTGSGGFATHLNYGNDAAAAANFVINLV